MNFGVAVDCLFRHNKDFKAGVNWDYIYSWLRHEVRLRYDLLRESVRMILDACEKRNIALTVENMRLQYPDKNDASLKKLLGEEAFTEVLNHTPRRSFPGIGGDIVELLEFVESFDSECLGICIDTGQAMLFMNTKGQDGPPSPHALKRELPTSHERIWSPVKAQTH